MKVALCCIGKNENRYIREYVDHYRTIGVDKIFLFDNNDPDGERFEEVIQPEIDSGFVELINYRGEKVCQLRAYQECYDKHGGEYDWICFFDCDEFWDSRYFNNIKDFLGQRKFNPFDMIQINWLCFGDNNQLRYENKPLKKRFTEPIPLDRVIAFPEYGWPENFMVKTIVRGGRIVYWLGTSHCPYPNKHLFTCNCLGNLIKHPSHVCPYDREGFSLKECHLRHYSTKSAEEYALKMKRGFPDGIWSEEKKHQLIDDRFFRTNAETPEKRKIIEEIWRKG